MNDGIKYQSVLSIETAILGGSLSLIENGEELDCWIGRAEVSKAEDVLQQIEILFERNDFKKESLNLIVVSAGPGSSTGIKIGLSLARGLSKALKCEIAQASVLESLLLKASRTTNPIITALPVGKDLICRQVFGNSHLPSEEKKSKVSGAGEFFELITHHNNSQIICHEQVFSLLSSKAIFGDKSRVINAGENMAKLIGANYSDNLRCV